MAYSVRCAPFRTTIWITRKVLSDTSGLIQRTMAASRPEVRCVDMRSVEAAKIRAIQTTTGIQSLRTDADRGTER
jgi:hypothetical protein